MSNMSETPTNTPNQQYPTSDERFAGISDKEWQDNKDIQDSLAAARRINESDQPVTAQPVETTESRVGLGTKIATGFAIAGAVAGGVAVVEANNGPDFPETTTTYTVESGDGLQDVAEAVPGSDKVDITEVTHFIKTDPANIDALKDGLQPGETIEIPTSVEP